MKVEKAKKISTSEKYRVAGKAFWNMAKKYGLSRSQQAALLDIRENRQRLIRLEEDKEIPEGADKLLRVGILLGIHKNLRILFPYNRDLHYKWPSIVNEDFGGISPFDYITQEKEESLVRLIAVRRKLDQIRVGGH